jgi:hypothetical protein
MTSPGANARSLDEFSWFNVAPEEFSLGPVCICRARKRFANFYGL